MLDPMPRSQSAASEMLFGKRGNAVRNDLSHLRKSYVPPSDASPDCRAHKACIACIGLHGCEPGEHGHDGP